ncbi:hypothetical protein ACFYSC_16660 [Streptosporangium sp. NPDC004379]|uniref:hypothetical protein n=1 Tax=Streptosporangium sp. NPDC004379 TaxID=3366189 RepID=UPI0036744C88
MDASRRRVPGPVGLVLGALALVLLGAALWAGMGLREARAAAGDREAALRAAGEHAVALMSVGYQNVDADMRRVLGTSTGQARAEYVRDAAALRETTVGDRLLRTGALRASGLVSLRGDTAEALVVGDAVVRGEGSESAPREQFYRWRMQLTRASGGWLVSKVEQVS